MNLKIKTPVFRAIRHVETAERIIDIQDVAEILEQHDFTISVSNAYVRNDGSGNGWKCRITNTKDEWHVLEYRGHLKYAILACLYKVKERIGEEDI